MDTFYEILKKETALFNKKLRLSKGESEARFRELCMTVVRAHVLDICRQSDPRIDWKTTPEKNQKHRNLITSG